MSEKFKPYTEQEAYDEALKMQEKIKSGEVENYNEAEKTVEEEKVLEDRIKEMWRNEAILAENQEVYSAAADEYEKAGDISKTMEMWKKDIERGESKKDWMNPSRWLIFVSAMNCMLQAMSLRRRKCGKRQQN